VEFGVALPNMQFGAPPTADHILRVAQAAEASGYTSVWASDHILIPSGFPRYGILYEALTTIAWLAAKTSRIRVGTSILVLPMRNAILAAKQAATLDDLSGGRVVLGVAAGWNEGEFRNLSADFEHRGRVLDESIAVMRNLFTADRPSFSGRTYTYEDALFFPKPAQPGGPPIWVGGNSEAALRRAATLGDGWHGDDVPPADFATSVATLRRLSSASGRTVVPTVRHTVDLFAAAGTPQAAHRPAGYYKGDEAEVGMKGSYAGMIEHVRQYRELGATDFICQFEHNSADQHVAFVETFAREVMAKI
jgi:probable F420-dependent oxidoreductase